MNSGNYSLTNSQGWTYRYKHEINDGKKPKITINSLTDPNGKELLGSVKYIFDKAIKQSKIAEDNQNRFEKDQLEKIAENKTLSRQLIFIHNQGALYQPFEACEKQINNKKYIFIVFGKTPLHHANRLLGAAMFAAGCVATASGVAAAPLILAASSSMLFDAWQKDVVDHDLRENLKQSLIGGLASVITGGITKIIPFGSAASSLARKVAACSAKSTIGYAVAELFNLRYPNTKGALTAALSGGVAPAVSEAVGSQFTVAATNYAVDQIDDLANAIFLKSAAQGASGAIASQATQQAARIFSEGPNDKETLHSLLLSGLMGAASSVAADYPKVEKIKNYVEGYKSPEEKANSLTTPKKLLPKAQEFKVHENLHEIAKDLWQKDIEKMIGKGFKVELNGKLQKPPKKDVDYHTKQILVRLAKGEQLTFSKHNEKITLGFTQNSDNGKSTPLTNEEHTLKKSETIYIKKQDNSEVLATSLSTSSNTEVYKPTVKSSNDKSSPLKMQTSHSEESTCIEDSYEECCAVLQKDNEENTFDTDNSTPIQATFKENFTASQENKEEKNFFSILENSEHLNSQSAQSKNIVLNKTAFALEEQALNFSIPKKQHIENKEKQVLKNLENRRKELKKEIELKNKEINQLKQRNLHYKSKSFQKQQNKLLKNLNEIHQLLATINTVLDK